MRKRGIEDGHFANRLRSKASPKTPVKLTNGGARPQGKVLAIPSVKKKSESSCAGGKNREESEHRTECERKCTDTKESVPAYSENGLTKCRRRGRTRN